MHGEEEKTLLAAVEHCHLFSHDASEALRRPACSVVMNSAAHHILIEADRAAWEQYETAKIALRAWRDRQRRISGAAG